MFKKKKKVGRYTSNMVVNFINQHIEKKLKLKQS